MDTKSLCIMTVIDPTRDDQWALKKALAIARSRPGSTISAFLAVFSDTRCDIPERLRQVELARQRLWLDAQLKSLDLNGVAVQAEVVWNADWREAVCLAAVRGRYDLVIKHASDRPSSLANSDRQLIRSLHGSALLLVKRDPQQELRKVLIAVDFNAADESHAELNKAIIALGQKLRGSSEAVELHSISAYPEADRFVHPPDVAKLLGIARSHAHVQQGSAAEVIPKVAKRIHADLVIVGNVGRIGVAGVTVGNTSEKILAELEADVLVMVPEEEQARSAA